MVIDNLNFVRAVVEPLETDAPLVIDSNAVLAATIAAQRSGNEVIR
jgi:hypothetical protein